MKRLAFGLAAACVAYGLAAAQTTTPGTGTAGTPGTVGTPGTTGAGSSTANSTGTATNTGVGSAMKSNVPGQNGKEAAAGDNNQAIATTDANANKPARGSNSFTASEARGRIQDKGFANVTDLKKDNAGVWRGKAQKNGQTVSVWLDYKGNVGQ